MWVLVGLCGRSGGVVVRGTPFSILPAEVSVVISSKILSHPLYLFKSRCIYHSGILKSLGGVA